MKIPHVALSIATAAVAICGPAAAQNAAAVTGVNEVTAAACTLENAAAASSVFTPLPAGWSYAVSEVKAGEAVTELRNLQPETVNIRHADRWTGVTAATATCTPVDAAGKSAAGSPAFRIAVAGKEMVRERIIICANGQKMSGWTGSCPLVRVGE